MSSVTTPTTKTLQNPSTWRVGTVTHIRSEGPDLRTYTLDMGAPVQHDPGQHYEIRLTSADGYQAARLYSAAMPANASSKFLQLTIALMPYGEISPYLFNHVTSGSRLEIRGPFGGYFNWTPAEKRPLLLVAGGTGIVPLRAIRLAHQQTASKIPIRLLYSVKTYQDMAYKYEICPPHGDCPDDVTITFTSKAPPGWKGRTGRIDAAMVQEALGTLPSKPAVYVCGPTPFVETSADLLVAAGIDPSDIKTERFGPTS